MVQLSGWYIERGFLNCARRSGNQTLVQSWPLWGVESRRIVGVRGLQLAYAGLRQLHTVSARGGDGSGPGIGHSLFKKTEETICVEVFLISR